MTPHHPHPLPNTSLTTNPPHLPSLPALPTPHRYNPHHPDPIAEQLGQVVPILKIMLKFVKEKFGEHMTIGVMVDFMSYPQYPRSKEEDTIFGAGLKGELNGLYSHPYAPTLMITTPASEHPLHTNTRAYEKRGWTYIEARLSSIVMDAYCLWDLSKLTGEEKTWGDLYKSMRANRLPITSPDRVAKDLRAAVESGEIAFTKGADLDLVLGIYERGFAPAFEGMQAKFVHYSDLGWGDEVVPILTEAIKYAEEHCDPEKMKTPTKTFELWGNKFTEEGKQALRAAAGEKMKVNVW